MFLGLSLAVIARSTVMVDGELYFTLFDDAMISMKYAKNLYAGHGLVWNPGEYVEGYTNPLWTLIMAGFHGLGLPASKICLAIMLFCLGLAFLALRAVERLTRQLSGDEGATVMALWLAATGFGFLYWSLHGMEVGFITLLLLLGMELVFRLKQQFTWGRWLLLLAVTLAVLLTRMDSLVPMAVMAGWSFLFLRGRGRWLVPAGIALMCAGSLYGLYLFRLDYYGEAFPNTYYLKLTGVNKAEVVSRGVKRFAGDLLVKGLLVALIPVVLAGIKRLFTHAEALLVAALVGSACAYSMYVGGDAWEYYLFSNRYLSTVFPFLCILLGVQVAGLVAKPQSGRLYLGLLAGGLLVAAAMRWSQVPVYNQPLLLMDYLSVGLLAAMALALLVPQARAWLQSRLSLAGLSAFALIVALNMPGILAFALDRTDYYNLLPEKKMTALALAFRAQSQPDTKAAIFMAGAFPYFSDRYCADVLGKMDKHIARMNPVRKFIPGHNKWDHLWIMEHYVPDIFIQTRTFVKGEAEVFAAHGYTQQGDYWVNAAGLAKISPAFLQRPTGLNPAANEK